MPPAKKNLFSGYLTIIGSLIPIAAILIAMVAYVINLNSTVGNNNEELESITEQLEAAKEILEVNPYGESELSNRINGIEYFIYEELEARADDMEMRLLLIDEAIQDLIDTQAGINHYLYAMDDGPQKALVRISEAIALLNQSVESVHKDHAYFIDVLEEIEDEFDVRLSKPPDTYGSYGSYGR